MLTYHDPGTGNKGLGGYTDVGCLRYGFFPNKGRWCFPQLRHTTVFQLLEQDALLLDNGRRQLQKPLAALQADTIFHIDHEQYIHTIHLNPENVQSGAGFRLHCKTI